MKNEVTSIICPICNISPARKDSPNKTSTVITDLESGEIICSKCGIVINDRTSKMVRDQIHVHLVMSRIITKLD